MGNEPVGPQHHAETCFCGLHERLRIVGNQAPCNINRDGVTLRAAQLPASRAPESTDYQTGMTGKVVWMFERWCSFDVVRRCTQQTLPIGYLAIKLGASKQQVVETILQMTFYAGGVAVANALPVAAEVFSQHA